MATDPEIAFQLGLTHFALGEKHPPDYQAHFTTAFQHFQFAAESEHAQAQAKLGLMYELGYGVKPDLTKALHFNQLAAEKGIASAQRWLGLIYAQGESSESGTVEIDETKAKEWLGKAAAQGDEVAQAMLQEKWD